MNFKKLWQTYYDESVFVCSVYDGSVNEEDITGVIIITVVCCAVGTSIVWVIIIYQTRKRLNTPPVVQTKTFHLDNKSEHSSGSSKDSGTGDSTKRSHEDLLLETGIARERFSQLNQLSHSKLELKLSEQKSSRLPLIQIAYRKIFVFIKLFNKQKSYWIFMYNIVLFCIFIWQCL